MAEDKFNLILMDTNGFQRSDKGILSVIVHNHRVFCDNDLPPVRIPASLRYKEPRDFLGDIVYDDLHELARRNL